MRYREHFTSATSRGDIQKYIFYQKKAIEGFNRFTSLGGGGGRGVQPQKEVKQHHAPNNDEEEAAPTQREGKEQHHPKGVRGMQHHPKGRRQCLTPKMKQP